MKAIICRPSEATTKYSPRTRSDGSEMTSESAAQIAIATGIATSSEVETCIAISAPV